MDPILVGTVAGKALEAIADLIPTPEKRAMAEVRLLQATQAVMVEEARSRDRWTSRARPGFLYVMYLMILASIPMGGLYAFSPATALAISSGVQQWLAAIPEPMWWLFGAGYLGYTGSRGMEKLKGAAK